jgi:hypothetical protein
MTYIYNPSSTCNAIKVNTPFRSTVATSIIAVATLTLSGCATTQGITPAQCQTSNWEEVGFEDGLNGRSGAYFGQYTNACASVVGATPNRIVWEQGRQNGLRNYCTELNAYKTGREGYSWQTICPLEGIEKLEEAYAQGRYYYIRQRDLNNLYSPYPFGYSGYNRFGYRPFGYGW